MIVFLYGQDSYRLKQNLDKIIDEHRKKYFSGVSLGVLDFSETDQTTDLGNAVKSRTFFDEKRLTVVKNPFGQAQKIADLIKTSDLAAD